MSSVRLGWMLVLPGKETKEISSRKHEWTNGECTPAENI